MFSMRLDTSDTKLLETFFLYLVIPRVNATLVLGKVIWFAVFGTISILNPLRTWWCGGGSRKITFRNFGFLSLSAFGNIDNGT